MEWSRRKKPLPPPDTYRGCSSYKMERERETKLETPPIFAVVRICNRRGTTTTTLSTSTTHTHRSTRKRKSRKAFPAPDQGSQGIYQLYFNYSTNFISFFHFVISKRQQKNLSVCCALLINAEKKVPKVSNFPERACHAIKVNFLQLVTMARQRKHTSQVLRVFRWKTHMGGFHPPPPTPRRFLLLLLFFFSMFTVGRPPKGAAFPLSGLPLPRAVKDLPSYGRIKNRRRERPFPPFFLAQLPNQTYSKRSILLENNSHCSPPQFSRALRFLIGASESYTELIFLRNMGCLEKAKGLLGSFLRRLLLSSAPSINDDERGGGGHHKS